MTGDVHRRKPTEQGKVLQPPTSKQIEAADRLCRGYCSIENDALISTDKHQNSEVGAYPSMPVLSSIPKRVNQDMKEAKERRKRIEERFAKRGSLGIAVKALNLNFDQEDISMSGASKEGERHFVDFAGRDLRGWSMQK